VLPVLVTVNVPVSEGSAATESVATIVTVVPDGGGRKAPSLSAILTVALFGVPTT
jgi:hypothetical protein